MSWVCERIDTDRACWIVEVLTCYLIACTWGCTCAIVTAFVGIAGNITGSAMFVVGLCVDTNPTTESRARRALCDTAAAHAFLASKTGVEAASAIFGIGLCVDAVIATSIGSAPTTGESAASGYADFTGFTWAVTATTV